MGGAIAHPNPFSRVQERSAAWLLDGHGHRVFDVLPAVRLPFREGLLPFRLEA